MHVIKTNNVNDALVTMLKDLLKEAEEGKINTMGFVTLDRHGEVLDGWCIAESANPFTLIGSLFSLTSSIERKVSLDDE